MTVEELLLQVRTTSCEPDAGTAPVPESSIVTSETVPLFAREAVPVTLPLVAGLKLTLNEVLWPAASTSGRISPLNANSDPLVLAAEIVMLCPPGLLAVIV